jgi:ATP-dependent RNA helicase SUPV3L1/SUV3
VTVADVPEIPLEVLELPMSPAIPYLRRLEELHKGLILFLWLSYRFVDIFADRDMAMHAKAMSEEKISLYLTSFSSKKHLQRRLEREKERDERRVMMADQSTAVDDFSEHASEDMNESLGGESDEATHAIDFPIDGVEPAEDFTSLKTDSASGSA